MPVTDLDLRQLRYLVTVAEELSFVRAAALLRTTHPALAAARQGARTFADILASVRPNGYINAREWRQERAATLAGKHR
jgi:hypothetical protein